MTYGEIFIFGWNLNALMFVINLILAFRTVKQNDVVTMSKEHEILGELKEEMDKFYPNRGMETLISYFIPFTAFFRVSWRLIEMTMFFNKNQDAKMFDFMVYKYQVDIQKAKNR